MTLLNRATRLRIHRVFRRRQKQVENATIYAGQQFDDNFIARVERLLDVKRFIFSWLLLAVLITVLTILQTVSLHQFYLSAGPVPGGVFNEGMVGTYSNANPIYATGTVDVSLSRLLFAGLFKYDDQNKLVGDLASGYTVDASGKVYTVSLKKGLTWHDGKPLNADDVVFTYQLIQNPDAQSSLFSSWQNITVNKIDNYTVQFVLPNALTAFPYSMINGIVPKHILVKIPAAQLRASSFNTTEPVGAGPFMWEALQLGSSVDPGAATALIALQPFPHYNGGEPKLASYILHTYDSQDQLLAAYRKHNVAAAAGIQNVPKDLAKDPNTKVYQFGLTAETMVFFNNSNDLLKDVSVRTALVQAADRKDVLSLFDYSVKPANEPLLIGQLGYNKKYAQTPYNLAGAESTLQAAGWVPGKDGIRTKDGRSLSFQLLTNDTENARNVSKQLQKTWREAGIDVQLTPQQTADFQSSIDRHEYAAVLYSISVGVDPDVFVYWDSSQADVRSNNRLNLSEYKSTTADTALEAGRTRQDPVIRTLKYQAFLEAWQKDNPALALYQPNDIYLSRGKIAGLNEHALNIDADRYYSINQWMIKSGHIDK